MSDRRCSKCHRFVKGHEGPYGPSCGLPVLDDWDDNSPLDHGAVSGTELEVLRGELANLAAVVQKLVPTAIPKEQSEVLNDAGETLDKLFNAVGADVIKPATLPFDPRHRLTLRSLTKTVHITQFLTEEAKLKRKKKSQQTVTLETGENGTVLLKDTDSHPYSGITLQDWGAANMRLMNHLLVTGGLDRDHVEYYMAYTTSIFEFYDRYEWQSILHFDHAYREAQQAHGFTWGQLDPSMELHYLIPLNRIPLSARRQNGRGAKSNPQPCRQFLASGKCNFGEACRYTHAGSGNATDNRERSAEPSRQWSQSQGGSANSRFL